MNDLAIATTGLSKQYRGGVLAVDQVELRVARGEIYGFAVAIWGVAISAWVIALGLIIGALIGLPGWGDADAGATVAAIALAAILTITLQTGAAFFAGVGRGYIAPLAWTVAVIVVSQVLTVLGWGSWVPWSVPALLAGAGGPSVDPVTPAAAVLVLVVAAAGLVATVAWWEQADQTG